jgi:hypothetical protein
MLDEHLELTLQTGASNLQVCKFARQPLRGTDGWV